MRSQLLAFRGNQAPHQPEANWVVYSHAKACLKRHLLLLGSCMKARPMLTGELVQKPNQQCRQCIPNHTDKAALCILDTIQQHS